MTDIETEIATVQADVATIKAGAASALAEISASLERMKGFHAAADVGSAVAMANAIETAHSKLVALLHDSLAS